MLASGRPQSLTTGREDDRDVFAGERSRSPKFLCDDMRLLLVEDYAPIRTSVSQGLREAGFAVDDTDHGEEALWYATVNEYDVIILD